MRRIQIVTGHYGSGKTEYAVNLALSLAAAGHSTTLADLDIVNPYFRSYEQTARLEAAGVKVIVTSCGGAADIPALNPAVLSIFQNDNQSGVLDIGGDPIGARVLARFAPQLAGQDFDLLYVLNANPGSGAQGGQIGPVPGPAHGPAHCCPCGRTPLCRPGSGFAAGGYLPHGYLHEKTLGNRHL